VPDAHEDAKQVFGAGQVPFDLSHSV